MLYIFELCFIILEAIKCQSGLLYHLVPALSSALGGCVVACLHSIGILICSRKCHCCELPLIINNLPVCNFFRKPGNMLFRKPSTCLIHGQNFTLRTLRRNKPLVTGLWIFLLLMPMLNRMCCFMHRLCLCRAEYV